MEDGQDRARRFPGAGGEGGRRRAREEPSADDILARYGLVAAPAGGRAARRYAVDELERSGREAALDRFGSAGTRTGRHDAGSRHDDGSLNGSGGHRHYRPDPNDEPDLPPWSPAGTGRRRAAEPVNDSGGSPGRQARHGSGVSRDEEPLPGGVPRRAEPDAGSGRRRRADPEPDAYLSPGSGSAPYRPGVEGTGGSRRARESAPTNGARHRTADSSGSHRSAATGANGGRRARPEPDGPPSTSYPATSNSAGGPTRATTRAPVDGTGGSHRVDGRPGVPDTTGGSRRHDAGAGRPIGDPTATRNGTPDGTRTLRSPYRNGAPDLDSRHGSGRAGSAEADAPRASRNGAPDVIATTRRRGPVDDHIGPSADATRAAPRPAPDAAASPDGASTGRRHAPEPAVRPGAAADATHARRPPVDPAGSGRASEPPAGQRRAAAESASGRSGATPEATRAIRRSPAEPTDSPRRQAPDQSSGPFRASAGAAPAAAAPTRATRRPPVDGDRRDTPDATRATRRPGAEPISEARGRTPEGTGGTRRRPVDPAGGGLDGAQELPAGRRRTAPEPGSARFGATPEATRATRRPSGDAGGHPDAPEPPAGPRRAAPEPGSGRHDAAPEATRGVRRPPTGSGTARTEVPEPPARPHGSAPAGARATVRPTSAPTGLTDAPEPAADRRRAAPEPRGGRYDATREATRATRRPPADPSPGAESGSGGFPVTAEATRAVRRPLADAAGPRNGAPDVTRTTRRPLAEPTDSVPGRRAVEPGSGRFGTAPEATRALRRPPTGAARQAGPVDGTRNGDPDGAEGTRRPTAEARRAIRRPSGEAADRPTPEPGHRTGSEARLAPRRPDADGHDLDSARAGGRPGPEATGGQRNRPGIVSGSGGFGVTAEATRAMRPGRRPDPEPPSGQRQAGHRPGPPRAAGRTASEALATTRVRPVPGRAPGGGAEATAIVPGGRRRRARPEDEADPEPGASPTTRVSVDALAGSRKAERENTDPEDVEPEDAESEDAEPEDAQPRNGAAPDRSERAELARRAEREEDPHTRALRIDETLTRLTAAHAGIALAGPKDADHDEPPSRRRIRVTPGRIVAAALALVVLATTAFGWGTKSWLGSGVREVAALDTESGAIVDAAAQAGDQNVLVVGGESPVVAGKDTTPRADTIAVVHIPAGGSPVTVLSLPNNLEINRPSCEKWDPKSASYSDTEPAEARAQLVSALDVGGPRCITRVVQQLSGLAITKYVGIDLDAVRALTDAVGGVEVCVPQPVLDGVLGPIVPDAGTNRIEGVRTFDFVRAGDVQGDPSPEYGRVERQQQVLAAVLEQTVSDTGLLDVGKVSAVRSALSQAVVTDGAGIDDVLALARTLSSLDTDGITFAAVPTGDPNNQGNTVLRDTDAASLFAAVRNDTPLPAQATDPRSAQTGPSPSDVTVAVYNASNRKGLAGQVSETLRSLGFGVGEVGSADEPSPQTVIHFSPDQAAAAELLAATVPSATSVPDPGTTGVLHLVLGRSFDDVVRAPSEPVALQATTTTAAPASEGAPVSCS